MPKVSRNLSLDDFFKKIFEAIFKWRVEPHHHAELYKADAILSLSFGMRSDDSGLSNHQMARIVEDLHYRLKLPVISQWEIADATALPKETFAHIAREVRENKQAGKLDKIINKIFGTSKSEDPTVYLDTIEVLEQAKEVMVKNGWKRAVIVAHFDHYWRVIGVAKKIGIEPVVPYAITTKYDPASLQKYTRSRGRFILREIQARFYYILKGWL